MRGAPVASADGGSTRVRLLIRGRFRKGALSSRVSAPRRACSSMVEPAAHNRLVGGSSPSGPTIVIFPMEIPANTLNGKVVFGALRRRAWMNPLKLV